MKFIVRGLAALAAAVLAGAAIRLSASGETPPEHGGWQPMDLPE